MSLHSIYPDQEPDFDEDAYFAAQAQKAAREPKAFVQDLLAQKDGWLAIAEDWAHRVAGQLAIGGLGPREVALLRRALAEYDRGEAERIAESDGATLFGLAPDDLTRYFDFCAWAELDPTAARAWVARMQKVMQSNGNH